MAIQPRTKLDLRNEDHRWIAPGGISALADCDTVVLDRSAFDLVTRFPNGFVPSGVVLGKIAATGLYGPYGGTTEEVWSFTEGGSGLTSWTFTPDGGSASASLDDDATDVQVQAEVDEAYGEGNIIVTRTTVAPSTWIWTVDPDGELANTNLTPPTTTPTGGTGTVVVATVTAGGADATSDGTEVAAGFLAVSVVMDRDNASTADELAALYWHGEVDESALPTNHGLDAAAKADLAAKFRFI